MGDVMVMQPILEKMYADIDGDYSDQVYRSYRMEEQAAINALMSGLAFSDEALQDISESAVSLIKKVREVNAERSLIEAFMMKYDLSTAEGVLMMCIAEALLRIPDNDTVNLLLQDKLTGAAWENQVGGSESAFINIATWGLALSGKVLNLQSKQDGEMRSIWSGLVRRSGEPVIRAAVREAMKVLSKQFVIGETIEEGVRVARETYPGYKFSYDMLGEVARTQKDADDYYDAYFNAITAIGNTHSDVNVNEAPSISVKLSALFPRYEVSAAVRAIPYLIDRLKQLALHAKALGVGLTIDAEESDRLTMLLTIFQALFLDDSFSEWNGFGLALQAYQKRAYYILDWLIALARKTGKRIQVRLVKGAYWDSEIKMAQVEGLSGYPVFTRKVNTDLSYLACAKKMLLAQDAIYPQFATHNAYTTAVILYLIEKFSVKDYEFQSLQGMGAALHNQLISTDMGELPCRIYAPIGRHKDLLPYLVRRLLENGANSSFVHKISDPNTPIQSLVEDPVSTIKGLTSVVNPKIPLPKDIFGVARQNSIGIDLTDMLELRVIAKAFSAFQEKKWEVSPSHSSFQKGESVLNPATRQTVGVVQQATMDDVQIALQNARASFIEWSFTPILERARVLNVASDLLQEHAEELMYLLVCEAGKTLIDANAELREAIDFCRYYAKQAELTLTDRELPGPTGEANTLMMRGRGVFVCISPWNFPLAIFVGQVVAALVAGNSVIAKPAEQTPLVAGLAVKLLHQAGIPSEVLTLLPGTGKEIGAALITHPDIDGVMFTGGTETAHFISKTLANRVGPIIPFVAETGGLNAMIADSTALPEQLIHDVIISAFGSAGQRCSALRVLFIQEDIAEEVLAMLAGAMAELVVGNPICLDSDIGPVIDEEARRGLQAHVNELEKIGKCIFKVTVVKACIKGTYFAPQVYEIPDMSYLKKEVFGPILHVVRYSPKQLESVIDQINQSGFGLTFGIQSRINKTIDFIQKRVKVGNIYVNRNITGAVVGVQPFGGARLSGTGPKAGGPHYLPRLSQECTLSVDTTAVGGNATLMAMQE